MAIFEAICRAAFTDCGKSKKIEVLPAPDPSDAANPVYTVEFGDLDLSGTGALIERHDLNKAGVNIQLFDSDGKEIHPPPPEELTPNTVKIKLSEFRPLAGYWKLIAS